MDVKTIGIIGAGKLGVVLAQLALKAGYKVLIAGSGSSHKIALTIDTLAPGAVASTSEEVARRADVIILALPLGRFREIPRGALAGKLVLDAANYWWEVDGPRNEIIADEQSSSEVVQEYFSDARVVKALSHMSYHDLYDEARPTGTPGRKAIAIAGDNEEAVSTASKIIDMLGFDPEPVGLLTEGRRLEPGSPVFGASVDKTTLRRLLSDGES